MKDIKSLIESGKSTEDILKEASYSHENKVVTKILSKLYNTSEVLAKDNGISILYQQLLMPEQQKELSSKDGYLDFTIENLEKVTTLLKQYQVWLRKQK